MKDPYKVNILNKHIKAEDEDQYYFARVTGCEKPINLDKGALELLKSYYEGKDTAKTLFDVTLIEKPSSEGLTRAEIMDLHDMLSEPEAFPVEIGDTNDNSSAMGFITPQAAEKLQYEYGQDSDLGHFISSILDDMDKESEDGAYTFMGLRIWMSREVGVE